MIAQYFYRVKKSYKMKIEFSQFTRYHRYTHTLLTNVVCSVLGIDNVGNIEIYYIVAIRNGIVVHMNVSNVGLGSSGSNSERQDIGSTSEQFPDDGMNSSSCIYCKYWIQTKCCI